MNSPKHERAGIADDFVHARAIELHISVQELFARAFHDAGLGRTSSLMPYRNYALKSGDGTIPEEVRVFCGKPLPRCANPDCPNGEVVARFTKTNTRGATLYVCSVECMNATPDIPDTLPTKAEKSVEGLAIIERVRAAVAKSTYVEVDPRRIRPLKGQPRSYFDPTSMKGLTDSLKEVGQLFPGLIRSIESANGADYELLDGERRWQGVMMVDIDCYRAMLVDIDDEAAPFVVSVIANFNREGHTLLEEVDAVIKLHDDLKLTHAQIGKLLGKHLVEISRLYGLRRLAPEIRDMLDVRTRKKADLLPKNAAIEISKENLSPTEQIRMAERLMRRELTIPGLKREIASRGHSGARPYARGPESLRERTAVRIRRLKLLLGDLKIELLPEGVQEALSGYGSDTRQEVLDDLHAARVLLAECEEIVKNPQTRKATAA